MRRGKQVLAALILAVAPSAVMAQAGPRPELRTGGYFANLFRFEFLPGKSDEGLAILNETIIPSFRGAKVNVRLMEDLMGEKDVYLIVPLRDGPAHYSYSVPPQDIDLWHSLNRLAGGPEEGEKRLDKFISYVRHQSQTLVFIPQGGPL